MNSSEEENTGCSCVTFDNKGCIFENICPDYIGKPSPFNRACLTLSKKDKSYVLNGKRN